MPGPDRYKDKQHRDLEKYKAILEALPDIVYEIDPDGKFVYISDSITALGYQPAELLGKHFSTIIHPNDVAQVSRYIVLPRYNGIKTGDEKAPKLFDERRAGKRSTKDMEVRLIAKPQEGAEQEKKEISGLIIIISDVAASGLYEADGADRKFAGTVGIIKDVTERKKAEMILRESEERFRDLVEQAGIAILIEDREGKFKYFNRRFAELFGYTMGEMKTKNMQSLVHPEDAAEVISNCEALMSGKDAPTRYEFRGVKKDGSLIHAETSVVLLKSGEFIVGIRYYIWDLTARRKTESELRRKTEIEAQLLKISRDLTETLDINEVLKRLAASARQLLRVHGCAIYLLSDDRQTLNPVVAIEPGIENEILATPLAVNASFTGQAVNNKKGIIFNDAGVNTTGQQIPGTPEESEERVIAVPFTIEGKVIGAMCLNRLGEIFTDSDLAIAEAFATHASTALKNARMYNALRQEVAGRKQAESAWITEQAYFNQLFENSPEGIIAADNGGRIINANPEFLRLFGYSLDEIKGRAIDELLAPADLLFEAKAITTRATEGQRIATETVRLRRDSTLIQVSILIAPIIIDGKQVGVYAVYRDITERKQAEEARRRSEEEFRRLFENAAIGVYRTTPDGGIILVNPAMVQMLGYTSVEELTQQNIESDLYHPAYTRAEFKKQIELDGKVVGLESIWRKKNGQQVYIRENARAIFDDDGKVIYYEGIIEDITARIVAEDELKHNVEKLQKAIEQTVSAMAKMIETRDPYTAGHQQRVAVLAVAIAQEMGLDDSQVMALRMAAAIHDVGKIYVPAEILSRPGQLSETEFNLIKAHPQIGYQILKPIEFPWPVAEIVLQHHESLNGVGYPRQLSGTQIILAARILRVADVVEAMVSHRPYRPARALDTALEEIQKFKGILYDADVVGICVKLFMDKNFKLPLPIR